MQFTLGAQVDHVHIAHIVALGDDHRHAHHLRTGRVGAVGTAGDQADIAVALTFAFVEGLDDQQARIFTLAAGVGLQTDAGVTGGGAQPGTQLCVQLGVALALVGGAEGVDVGKLRPSYRNHLAGGVEFHRAAAQRDHAAVQRQILVAQHADVAQHAGLGMVGVEDRVGHEFAGAAQRGGDQGLGRGLQRFYSRQRLAGFGEQAPD